MLVEAWCQRDRLPAYATDVEAGGYLLALVERAPALLARLGEARWLRDRLQRERGHVQKRAAGGRRCAMNEELAGWDRHLRSKPAALRRQLEQQSSQMDHASILSVRPLVDFTSVGAGSKVVIGAVVEFTVRQCRDSERGTKERLGVDTSRDNPNPDGRHYQSC